MASHAIQALRSGGASHRLLAMVSSVVSACGLLALLPVVYLFVDLLVWKGHVPTYSTLAPARQQQFRDFWNANPNHRDYFKVAGQSEADSWETRWESATVDWLKSRVGEAASATYIHQTDEHPGGYRRTHLQDETRLGLLPTIAREQHRWTGSVLAGIGKYLPWLWQPGASGSANEAYLLTLFIIAFVLTVAVGLGALSARHYSSLAAIDLTTRIRRALYQHAFRIGSVALSHTERLHAGSLLTDRTHEIAEAEDRTLRSSVRNPILIAGSAIVLLMINPLLGGAMLAGGIAVWLVVGQIVAYFRRDSRNAQRTIESADARLKESMQRMLLVKSYLMDRFAQTRVERQLDECAVAERRSRRGSAFSRPFLLAVGSVAAVVLLGMLGAIVLGGSLSVAGMTQLLAAGMLLVWAGRSTIHHRVNAAKGRAAEADIDEFLERRTDPGQAIDAEFLQPIAKRLEFHNVGVREAGTGKMLLEEFTASIPAGSRVAVVAKDRDSLRSFAQTLVRFMEPTAGEIKADGKNLRWMTIDSLRTQIAYVAEDSFTITDTVANNIGCGDPGFGLPQVMEAAKVAHAHQFVQRLSYGYETLIGGPGTSLTTGQQYRIALARAILRDPSVLVVEEPESAIDADSAALVDDTLTRIRSGRTIIQLAHRESTLRAADTILVVDQGRVVANGTHDALMKNSEFYRRLGYRNGA